MQKIRSPLLALVLSACWTGIYCAAERPNVILVVADDLGSVDLGCYGAADLVTPHADALAQRGVRLTQFYSAAPVCSPSRAGTLTGRYPARAGVRGNYSHFFYWSGPNVHDLHRNGSEVFHDGEYFPELMLREASRFLEHHRSEPFFLYYALNTPHYPYQGEAKWRERFKSLQYPRNLYAAFVATQDERLGGLLAKVDALGLRERTIIVFQSDNGHSTEERAHFGGGNAGPYRGAKFSLFEGGIRLPAIVSWPSNLPENAVRDQVSHACDLLPTLAELTGVKPPAIHLDGRSLASVLREKNAFSPDRALHWQVGNGANAQWAVREGNWKLIVNTQDTSRREQNSRRVPIFLVNLKDDPGERINLAENNPDIVSRLRRLHEEHLSTP